MIDDLKLPRTETARPAGAGSPSRYERSRYDGSSPFNLLLTGQREPSAEDPCLARAGKSDVAAERAFDREPPDVRSGPDIEQAEYGDEAPGRPEARSTGETAAGDPGYASSLPASSLPASSLPASSLPASSPPAASPAAEDAVTGPAAAKMDPLPDGDALGTILQKAVLISPAAAISCGGAGEAPSIGESQSNQPASPDDAAATMAIMLAGMSCGKGLALNSVSPAGPAAVAAASAATHIIAASGAPLSPTPAPAGGGSMTQGEHTAMPANEVYVAAVPPAAALSSETPSDDRPTPQGKDQGDFRHLAVAAAAPAADTSSPTPVAADRPAVASRLVPDQIAIQMAHGAKNGLKRLHIALEPDNLGCLDIRIDFHRDGRLNATIVADRPETLNLLRSDAVSLEESLNAAGFKTSSSSLSFDLNSNSGRTASQPETPARPSGRLGNSDDISDDPPLTPAIWWPAVGRVDIRA